MNILQIRLSKNLAFRVVLLVFFMSQEVNAAKEVTLNSSGDNSTKVLENTRYRLRISNTIGSFNTSFLNTEKGEFVELLIDSYSKTNKIGAPQLPVVSKLIEIPAGTKPDVEVIGYNVKEYKLADFGITQKLFPAQAPQPKNHSQVKPLAFNQQIYQNNSFYGEALARVEVAGYLRGVQLANLVLSPVEYNPVTNTVRIYEDLVVEIRFSAEGNFKAPDERTNAQSVYYQDIFSRVLNYQPAETIPEVNSGIPEKYVIVSDPMFRDVLQPFIKWKIKRGFNVIEAYTSNPAVGNTTNSIRSYLQNLYISAGADDPAPSFVLFVGDVNQVPAFICGDHVSDLYYCEYTGDYLPEVFYGRFSANTIAELLPQINKTLQYEQYQLPDPSYLKDVVLVAGADATHQSRWGNGMVNYGTTYYFNQANNLSANTYLQPQPAGSNYTKSVRADIGKGVSFASYSAHGNAEGWADPLFSIADIPALPDNGKYGLIVGNACQTNAYDRNSFGEALLRAENKGALGYIGASGLSYWDEDYWWCVGTGPIVANPAYETTGPGAYDRVFHNHCESRSEWYSTIGQMVFAGNLAVQESNSALKKYYWESYCLMGDPSTEVYFGIPTPLTAEYSTMLPTGIPFFEVSTQPFANVAISKNNILHGVAVADENGLAHVVLNPIAEPGYADIVITKQNRQPFIDSVAVTTAENPYLVLRNVTIHDQDGNNNNLPENGETVSLDIVFDNAGNASAQKVVSVLSTADRYFTVTNGSYTWPDIPGKSSASAPDAFTVKLSSDVPDQHTAVFIITTQTGSGSYRSQFSITTYAPALENDLVTIDESTLGNGNLQVDAGESILVSIPTSNTGHSATSDVTTRLFVFEGAESIGSKVLRHGKLAPGQSMNSVFSFKVDPETEAGSVLSLFAVAMTGPYHFVSNLNIPVGAQAEHFEAGLSKYNWQFNEIRPWEITASAQQDGLFSARSGAITHSQKSEMYLEGQFLFNDSIAFYRKVSSENGYDFLKFFIDDFAAGSWSGNKDWEKVCFPLPAGNHRLRWVYEKDEATSAGMDAAWIDNIRLPVFSTASAEPATARGIAVPDTICAGGESQLFMFSPVETSSNTYQWSPGGTLSNVHIFNPLAAPTTTTTYGVLLSGKSFSASGNITVNVKPLPEPPVIAVSGDQVISSAPEGNQWYNSQGIIPGATSQVYTPTTAGTYYVINNFGGCPSLPSNEVAFGFTEISPSAENRISLYPNPFSDRIKINYVVKSAGFVTIELYNSLGNRIAIVEQDNKPAGEHQTVYNGNHLAAGIYTCKIVSNHDVKTVKLMKNK